MTVTDLLADWRIPSDILVAMDNRSLHFALQPYHYLIRATHVLFMAAFFGGIGLLDLRLMGVRATVPLRGFAAHTLPWVYACFAVTALTGVLLLLYDPVHAGARLYLVPKLALVALGLVNAALFHRLSFVSAQATEGRMPPAARLAGGLSLLLWVGVVLCSSLNAEGPPKLLLQ